MEDTDLGLHNTLTGLQDDHFIGRNMQSWWPASGV